MTDKYFDSKTDQSRFSWECIINDGQKRLASLIDIESPPVVDTPVSASTASVEPNHSNKTNTSEQAIAPEKGKQEQNKIVFGIDPVAKTVKNSTPSTASSTLLDVEASLIHPSSEDSAKSSSKAKSSLDRMRHIVKGHTNEQTKGASVESQDSATKKSGKHSKVRSKHRSKSNSDTSTISSNTGATAPNESLIEPAGSTMVEKLMDRLVTSSLPTVSFNTSDADWRAQKLKGQPPFSINTMTKNFRKMTSRTGIAFEILYTLFEVVSWKDPVFTMAVLAIYSFVVLNPQLVPIVPIIFLLSHIMVPSYMYRHPPDSNFIKPKNPIPAQGPALASPVIPKPVPELSREFFYNVVDTQNFMVLYIDGFDLVLEFLRRFAFFESDECTSSLVFSVLLGSSVLIYLLTPLIIQYTPWKLVFLSAGWGLAGISHPRFREQFIVQLKMHLRDTREKGKKTLKKVVTTTRARVAGVRRSVPSGSFASDRSVIFDNASVASHALTTDEEDNTHLDEHNDSNLSSSSSFSSSESSDDKENRNHENKMDTLLEKYNKFWAQVDVLARTEFNFIEPHEKRETEIFELQITYKSASTTNNAPYHWSASAFTSHPYLPLARGPVTSLSFMSCGALADVVAPPEWIFANWSRWKIDLDQGWVARRGIPIVAETGDSFVEFGADDNNSDSAATANEKWVCDKYPISFSNGPTTNSSTVPPNVIIVAALELLGIDVPVDENGDKYKLYLRRRRWIRTCIRQAKIPAQV